MSRVKRTTSLYAIPFQPLQHCRVSNFEGVLAALSKQNALGSVFGVQWRQFWQRVWHKALMKIPQQRGVLPLR